MRYAGLHGTEIDIFFRQNEPNAFVLWGIEKPHEKIKVIEVDTQMEFDITGNYPGASEMAILARKGDFIIYHEDSDTYSVGAINELEGYHLYVEIPRNRLHELRNIDNIPEAGRDIVENMGVDIEYTYLPNNMPFPIVYSVKENKEDMTVVMPGDNLIILDKSPTHLKGLRLYTSETIELPGQSTQVAVHKKGIECMRSPFNKALEDKNKAMEISFV